MKKHNIFLILINFLLIFKSFANDGFVIEASRDDKTLEQSELNISVTTDEEILKNQSKSVADAIDNKSNVEVQGGSRPYNQSVNIRGITGNRVVQLIDGTRVNQKSGHKNNYFLDPVLLKSIEVLKGPQSSLWGSGAIGGVVAQNTIDATDLVEPGEQKAINLYSQYNANNNGFLNSATFATLFEKSDLVINLNHNHANDLNMGNDLDLTNSSYETYGAFLKSTTQLTDEQSLTFSVRANVFDGFVPQNGAAALSDTSNLVVQRDAIDTNYILDYKNISNSNNHLNLNAKFYLNQSSFDEFDSGNNIFGETRNDTTDIQTLGSSIVNISKFNKTDLVYGFDGFIETFDATRIGTDRPEPPDATTEVYGAFLKATHNLTEDLDFIIGSRYDNFSTKAQNLELKNSSDAISNSVATKYYFSDNLDFTLSYSEAFRAPSSEELYTDGTHFCTPLGCNQFVPNPNLEAEEAANLELIANFQRSSFLREPDNLNIKTAIFRNEVDNFIEQHIQEPTFSDPGITTWQNVDEALLKGYEIDINYSLNKFKSALNYGYTKGIDENTGRDLANVPAQSVNLLLAYLLLDQTLELGANYNFVDSANFFGATETATGEANYDSYNLVDLYADYKISPDLNLNFRINNLFDEYYVKTWQEIYEPGRELIASINYKF